MSSMFYPKLAVMNIRKNGKTYFPFVITCITTIMMYYIMHAISINEGLNGVRGSESLKILLNLGTIVISIFSVIFLFYTNSFLIKRRKKEIGLFNILGLEKKHIALILFFESIIITTVSLVVGLLGGIILNKLMFLLLLKLMQFEVAFGFAIPLESIISTAVIFIGIFALALIFNLFQIQLANPITLLRGSEHGEKEPKTKWIMTIIGIAALGTGYGIAIRVQSPLKALNLFFVAVILVMIGTYALFTAGSIAALKLLRRNKGFYYKSKNFISVSGMLYRMKQNAVGLANICILSTMVLVMLSTTASLYVGLEDALKARYPRDILFSISRLTEEQAHTLEDIIDKEALDKSLEIENRYSYWYTVSIAKKEGDSLVLNEDVFMNEEGIVTVMAIPVSDYNRITGRNTTLEENEAIIYSSAGFDGDYITLGENTFKVKSTEGAFIIDGKRDVEFVETLVLYVNDIEALELDGHSTYSVGFDVEGTDEEIIGISNSLVQKSKENNMDIRIQSAALSRGEFLALHGGLFFLGIFLGALFLMATGLIIYYKQISEGYDDKKRFEIMQKVGMGKGEIKKTIKNQILMVFFLPLISAVIHIVFAFPIITKLMIILNLTNITLFKYATMLTILVFALIYGIIYYLTAAVYYRIVE